MAIFKALDGQLRELALFAGAGGGILGGKLLDGEPCALWNGMPTQHRVGCPQNDKTFEPFPIWDGVQTLTDECGADVLTSFLADFVKTLAQQAKGAGIDGERSGMWSHMARIVGEVRPDSCSWKTAQCLWDEDLPRVVGDLAALGYGCRWGVLGADDVGAPHERSLWFRGQRQRLTRQPSRADRELGRQSGDRKKQSRTQQDNGATDHNWC